MPRAESLELHRAALDTRTGNDRHHAALEACGIAFDDVPEQPDDAVLPDGGVGSP